MLRLQGGQVESLWDEVLPEKLRELPEDLPQIDALGRAGGGDGQEADPAARAGDGGRALPARGREGAAGDALPGAGGQDRLDGGRGGRALPHRLGGGGGGGGGGSAR